MCDPYRSPGEMPTEPKPPRKTGERFYSEWSESERVLRFLWLCFWLSALSGLIGWLAGFWSFAALSHVAFQIGKYGLATVVVLCLMLATWVWTDDK
jgi:hypothetical protein